MKRVAQVLKVQVQALGLEGSTASSNMPCYVTGQIRAAFFGLSGIAYFALT